MADNSYFFEIEPKILSRIKREFPQKLLDKYPHIKFSTDSQNDTTSYPFVYIHELSPVEVSRDLEGGNINGSLYTLQIEVADNTNNVSGGENGKAICKRVMRNVLNTLKDMNFDIKYLEFFDGDPNTGIARVRRVIGNDDCL